VVDGNIKKTFTAQTDTTWRDFSDKVHHYLAVPHHEVELGFQFGRETCAMSRLDSEQDWAKAIERLQDKMKLAQIPVSMQIRNVVSWVAYTEEGILAYLWTLAGGICTQEGTQEGKGETPS
jgi:hypothetical protein